MRFLSKTVSLFTNSLAKLDGPSLRHFAKALSQEQVSIPHQETLTGRMLIYFNSIDNEQRSPPPIKSSLEVLKNYRQNTKHLRKLSTNEIINFSSVLSDQNITRNELLLILRELDTECYQRLYELSATNILRLLNVYMNLVPGRITEFQFYKHAIKRLHETLPHLEKKDFLQFIFYVGLMKKKAESQNMLRECMRNMNDSFIRNLTSEELCIICNSTFKTSTKIINKSLLDVVRKHINNNLYVLKDCALFITLLKTLRHNRYQDDDLLNTISCGIFFNKTYLLYSFPVICHILSLYSDYFYYDEQLFKFFTSKCLEELNESTFTSTKLHPTEQLRGKDIKRFLWIVSMFSDLKLVSQSDIQNVILPKLIGRIECGEFANDIDSLVDITLFLWMLNYRSEKLVPYLFNNKSSYLCALGPKTKLRLNLLLYAIYLEDPDLSQKLSVKPVSIPSNVYSSYQLRKRPLIERLINNLNGIKKELNFHQFELSQEIPHLNIVGITGYKNEGDKALYIEVLDDYTRIRNVETDTPVGLMALKLRLLDRLEEGVLVVSQKEIEEMTEAELNNYLLDEIKLIC